ncbi:MAG: BRO family protein [Nostoc sp.]|uniref:BRO-N domain-containing protein n=1 Tax=Nostoc sp. TaxID=1180 RepID=UPI002FF0E412
MPTLSVFNFESHDIRFVGTADEPWWVASDICKVLDILNSRDALARLDDDEKGVCIADTLGGKQELATINESGLYSLVLTSRKAQAKRFKKWLTSEVIPAIRKTGTYSAIANSVPQLPPTTSPKLTELTNEQARIRKVIAELRSTLSTEEHKLQEVSQALITEAKAFRDTNPDLMKQAVLCQDILMRASKDNPFDRSVSFR